MPGLMIIAHAPLASSLKLVAQHAFPECAQSLQALDVMPDMPPDEIERQAREMLARVRNPEALVLTDVFGGTPCNVAQRLAEDPRVKVVVGVNVPMLWRSLCYSHEPLDAVVTRALSGGAQGVMQVVSQRPQAQQPRRSAHDQRDPSDQQ